MEVNQSRQDAYLWGSSCFQFTQRRPQTPVRTSPGMACVTLGESLGKLPAPGSCLSDHPAPHPNPWHHHWRLGAIWLASEDPGARPFADARPFTDAVATEAAQVGKRRACGAWLAT